MSNDNDIEVKLGASTDGLDAGMEKAAKIIKDKTGIVNRILKQQAEEAVRIKQQEADAIADAARKETAELEKIHKAAGDRMAEFSKQLQNKIVGMFSLGAIIGFVKGAKAASIEAEQSFRGLESVANYSGVGIGKAMKAAQDLAADGMMSVAEASKALQNLLSRGYNVDQAVNTLSRLKDSAAFNRQASLEMGAAIVGATEGLKNENSVLVDNAGVTKNVSVMWKEYAVSHGLAVQSMTQGQKIAAEYAGIMRETEAQVGNAQKAMGGMQGETAKLDVSLNNLNIALGQSLTPALTAMARAGQWAVENMLKPSIVSVQQFAIGVAAVSAQIGIMMDAVMHGNFKGLAERLKEARNLGREMMAEAEARFSKPMANITPTEDTGRRKAQDPTEGNIGQALVRIKEHETAMIKKALDDQTKAYRKALSDVEAIESQRIALAERNKKRIADILGEPEKALDLKAEDPSERFFNQAEARAKLGNTMAAAANALSKKDFDGAIQAGEKAMDLLAQLKEAGAQSNSVLAAQARQVAQLEDDALAGKAAAGKAKAESLQDQMEALEKQMKALKAIEIGIDYAKSEEAIIAANKRFQEILDAKPLVVKFETGAMGLPKPVIGGSGSAPSSMPSAAGGWDIPSGMNPVTQLHKREMVLPESLADVVRSAAGSRQGGATPMSLTFPGIGTFPVTAAPDVAQAMREAVATETLKYGRRDGRRIR